MIEIEIQECIWTEKRVSETPNRHGHVLSDRQHDEHPSFFE